ncbi:MAG: hypothetical protein JF590_02790 [Gemmatimonadetes bacterium]|nr:hypothetical protein [Gemmatimonadota bacterium]
MTDLLRPWRRVLVALLAALAGLSCASTDAVVPTSPYHFEAVAVDTQTVGTEDVSLPMTVRVLDQDGVAVTGVVVRWSVVGGHGTVTPAVDTTGIIGTSSVVYRTTAETGVDTVVAHLDRSDSVRFVLTVVAPASPTRDRLYFRTGGGFEEEVAANDTSIAFGVIVVDTFHVPIPGLEVRWSVDSGPGRVIATDTTNATGIAFTRYFATADTGTRRIMARIGPDTLLFFLHVAAPCAVGTLVVGQAIDSVMPGPGCDQGEFEVSLVAGQAYFLSETHHPDPTHNNVDFVDPVLTLWQPFDDRPVRGDRSRFLAFSDDEGGKLNSELFFVAPASGGYRALASSFARAGFGGYRIALESCPVIAATALSGTQTYLLPAIPVDACVRHVGQGTTNYRFLSVPVAAGEQVAITVSSDDFTPVWEPFTNWDPYGTGEGVAIGSGLTRRAMAVEAGVATIAIGGFTTAATGSFSVTLDRSFPAAPPAPRPPRPKLHAR